MVSAADPGPGRLTRDELAALVERGEIETVIPVFPDLYGRLMGKRLVGRFFVETVASHGMHACNYLLACDMEMDPVPGYRLTSWESGYGDFRCVPDWRTLRRAAWLEKSAIVLCDVATEPGGEPIEVAPRRLLERQIARARELGYVARAGSEIELARDDGAAGAGDHVRPDLREPPLREVGVARVELVRDRELEHAVAQELQPLVRLRPVDCPGGVRERDRRPSGWERVDQRRELLVTRVATGATRRSRQPGRRS